MRGVEERVGQCELVHGGGQLWVHDEAHRHVAALVGLEFLRVEAETLGLVEVLEGAGGGNAGYGLGHRGVGGQVLGIELGVVELPRVDAHGGHLRAELVAAVARAENVLLPAFDSWRSRGLTDMVPASPVPGTFDWLAGVFKTHQKWLTHAVPKLDMQPIALVLLPQ